MSTKICFTHYHNGNDTVKSAKTGLPLVRGTAVYATHARLVDLDTGKVIKDAWAYCSPGDSPSRAKGREIAKGRLLRKLGELPRQNKRASFVAQLHDKVRSAFAQLI